MAWVITVFLKRPEELQISNDDLHRIRQVMDDLLLNYLMAEVDWPEEKELNYELIRSPANQNILRLRFRLKDKYYNKFEMADFLEELTEQNYGHGLFLEHVPDPGAIDVDAMEIDGGKRTAKKRRSSKRRTTGGKRVSSKKRTTSKRRRSSHRRRF